MKYRSASILLFTYVLVAGCSFTSPLMLGEYEFQAGNYDRAAAYWNPLAENGNPQAQYNLGWLWEHGLGSTPQNDKEAGIWYFRAAQAGHVPAMSRLGLLTVKHGTEDEALTWLTLAARWGDNDAIQFLRTWAKPVPYPDLLHAEQESDAARARETAHAAALLGESIGELLSGNSEAMRSSGGSSGGYQASEVLRSETCRSDFNCGVGYTCVKESFKSSGVCMKTVDSYGIPQYDLPKTDSYGPNLDLHGQCTFDTQCPYGFKCDARYKRCIKR